MEKLQRIFALQNVHNDTGSRRRPENGGGGQGYLVLAELPPEPLYILGRLVDLGCQTGRVSHLRIFLINIFHLPQGLAAERKSGRVTREEGGK